MEKHDLHDEFHHFDQKIDDLKVSDPHFKKSFDEYHVANKAIHSIETDAHAVTDDTLNELRMKLVHLKDELYAM